MSRKPTWTGCILQVALIVIILRVHSFKNQLLIVQYIVVDYDTLDRGHIYKEICKQLCN